MNVVWMAVLSWFIIGCVAGIVWWRHGLLKELDLSSHLYRADFMVLIGYWYDYPLLFVLSCGFFGPFAFLADRLKK